MGQRNISYGLLFVVVACLGAGCGPSRVDPRSRSTTPPPDGPQARGPARPEAPRPARCARVQGGTLPVSIRSVLPIGGFRLLTSGLRASERPPCAGACAPPEMVLTLVDGEGAVCFRTTLPDEHRLGPVTQLGRTIFVAGPRRIHAVSWEGRRLATTTAEGLVGEPVALADGGAAFLDAERYVLAFRPDGTLRYRRRPETPAAPLALSPRPGGGLLVAFGAEVRGYDTDGVEMFRRGLPDTSASRGLVALGPRALWVWSNRGAYRFREDGSLGERLPPLAPGDGQLFAATLGPDGIFYALFAERGFHPVKLAAFLPRGAPHWSRPYTGARPGQCRLLPAPGHQLGVLCSESPLGRAVVRDREGITRFDEEVARPQLAFGPRGAFALAEDRQARDMSDRCRVRRWGDTGDEPRQSERAGRCPLLWADAQGALYLGHERLGP